MKIYNLGSLNIEHVYQVDNSEVAGAHLISKDYHRAPGGKGFYQSLAISRAGAQVAHVGFTGPEGRFIKKTLERNGVDTTHVYQVDHHTGQTFIQTTEQGVKNKVRYHGANFSFESNFLATIFDTVQQGDLLLIQNEINDIPRILEQAHSAKIDVTFHPSPFSEAILTYPLELVNTLIFSLTTGEKLTQKSDPAQIMQALLTKYPNMSLILTLGAQGAWYMDKTQKIKVPADPVHAIDEKQAGNTFVGYYLAHKLQGHPIESCLKMACRASALCVTRQGKSATIPYLAEIK